MLLRILKSNTLFSVLLIPLIGILFWMHSLRVPAVLTPDMANGAMPLYSLVCQYLKGFDFWQALIAFFLVIINSFFVAQLGSSFIFPNHRSYLPGILYLITVSSLKSLHFLLPVHLATLFVLISIYFILETYHNPETEITYTFNASFFLAVASLIYLPVCTLFPMVWISIFVLQKSDNWRLLAIPVLGFGAPWLFMWSWSFLSDRASSFWNEIITMLWTSHDSYLFDPYFLIPTVMVTLLAMLGSFSVIAVYHRMKVSIRKYFVIFYWMLGLVVVSALGLITIGVEIVALSTIPVVYFITHYFVSDLRMFWKEVLTWIYLGTMIFVLIFNP
jgi:hypothetical protein